MAESGCLKGAHFENFEVMGNCAKLMLSGDKIMTDSRMGKPIGGSVNNETGSFAIDYPSPVVSALNVTNYNGITSVVGTLPEGAKTKGSITVRLKNRTGHGTGKLTFKCHAKQFFYPGLSFKTTSAGNYTRTSQTGLTESLLSNTFTYTPVYANTNIYGAGTTFTFSWLHVKELNKHVWGINIKIFPEKGAIEDQRTGTIAFSRVIES